MQNISIPLTMKPLNIKLYDIARTKMNFNDDDTMEFVSSIHELNDHRFENLVTKEFLIEKIHGTDQRFVKFESNIDLRFTTLESKIDQRFTTFESAIDLRFTTLESTIDQRFTTSQASNNLQFNEIKTSFSSKISETKSELIKWMFIFWTGQITITIGIMLLFVKN